VHGAYTPAVRLKAVRLFLEEGFSAPLIAQELGVGVDSVHAWVQRYRKLGRAGLDGMGQSERRKAKRLPAVVHEQIVAVKREYPGFGVRRVAQWLRRVLLLPGSAETVRRTLRERGLMDGPRPRSPASRTLAEGLRSAGRRGCPTALPPAGAEPPRRDPGGAGRAPSAERQDEANSLLTEVWRFRQIV